MLAKKTSKNQITLPKKVVPRFSGVEYFDVSTDGESITLRPVQQSRAGEVRSELPRARKLRNRCRICSNLLACGET
jgi:hypothetical protein